MNNLAEKFIKVVMIICIFFLTNCAVFNKNNTPLIRTVDEYLIPEKKPQIIMMAPLYIPVVLVAGVLDAFLIHPVSVIPNTCQNAKHTFWRIKEKQYVSFVGTVPFRIILTPVLFTIVWLNRSLFDTDGGRKYTKKQSKNLETILDLKKYIKTEYCGGILSFYYELDYRKLSDEDKESLNDLSKYIYRKAFCKNPVFGNFNDSLEGHLLKILTEDEFYYKNKAFLLETFNKELYLNNGKIFYLEALFSRKNDIDASKIALNRLLNKPRLSNKKFFNLVRFVIAINHQPHIDILYSRIRLRR